MCPPLLASEISNPIKSNSSDVLLAIKQPATDRKNPSSRTFGKSTEARNFQNSREIDSAAIVPMSGTSNKSVLTPTLLHRAKRLLQQDNHPNPRLSAGTDDATPSAIKQKRLRQCEAALAAKRVH